jgi:apolipoprotein N-acyltransferase
MRKFIPAILSGVLMGTTFIPFPPWATLFCYVPLWLYLWNHCSNWKEGFFAGWWTQFVLSLIGFHWIYWVGIEFGHLPWPIALLGLLGFSALVHTYIAFASALGIYLRRQRGLSSFSFFVVMALLFSLSERLWPSIFPWNLGYTFLWAKLPLIQFADVIGFEGLSTLCLLFQAALASLWVTRKDRSSKKTLALFATMCGAFVAMNILGLFWKTRVQLPDAQIEALVVQANIGNLEKIQAEKGRGYQLSIIDDHLQLMRDFRINKPDLFNSSDVIIWPETAFPDFLDREHLGFSRPSYLLRAMTDFQKPFLGGAYSRENREFPLESLDYNALFLLNPDGSSLSPPYRKTHLLIFGEYLPLTDTFPFLLKWFPFVSNFGRGPGPSLLKQNLKKSADNSSLNSELLWGAQICYEGLFPRFTRELSHKGAQILINVTNDSWFGKSFEPYQHMTMTLARAIETRLPLIRSTNTGITTVMLADGTQLESSPLHKEWVGHYRVPYVQNPEPTFYVKYGHLDSWIWTFLLFGLILYPKAKRTL